MIAISQIYIYNIYEAMHIYRETIYIYIVSKFLLPNVTTLKTLSEELPGVGMIVLM